MSESFVRSHRDLRVYKAARKNALRIAKLARKFPPFERYSLASQILRSSRSVYANLTEAWRKRRYKRAFIAKLSDSETEAAETQEWIDTALELGYVDAQTASEIHAEYELIIRSIVRMIVTADSWLIKEGSDTPKSRYSDTIER